MLATLRTFSSLGIDALPVEVEVDVSPAGLPKWCYSALIARCGKSYQPHCGVLSMSARKAFYIHVFVLAMLIPIGVSEQYHWLDWNEPLVGLACPLLLTSLAMPVIIIRLATKEQQYERYGLGVSVAVILSVAITIASFAAIIPLVQ
jgi:hypothetical protein